MTAPQTPWTSTSADNTTLPSGAYAQAGPGSPLQARPPESPQRWPMVLLALSLVLGVAGGATIIVLLTGDDQKETATSERESRSADRSATSTAADDNDPSSAEESDEGPNESSEPEVTLADRVSSTTRPASAQTTGLAPASTPPVNTPTTAATAPPTASDSLLPPKNVLEGRYVAIVWSELRSSPSDAEIIAKVNEYRAQFGDVVIGLRGSMFTSLTDGAIAVAVDNEFSSARQGAEWCRNQGLDSGSSCFGVILSDTTGPDTERGDYTRLYPGNL